MNYQMRLIDLMQLVDSDTVSTTVVSGLSLDSRRLKSGDLFFALLQIWKSETNISSRQLQPKLQLFAIQQKHLWNRS